MSWPSSRTRTPPPPCFSTARHESRLDDPDDTRVLDPVVRFHGQRVAVVVAESLREASRALGLIEVEYEVLPAVVDPEVARSPGAPLVHGDKGPEARISEPGRNVVAQLHAEMGSVSRALAASAHRVNGTYRTSRVSHAALETHATRGWLDEDGRLVLRTTPRSLTWSATRSHTSSGSTLPACACSPAASAAGSAASGSCSPRTSSRSPSCAQGDRCSTRCRAPTS